MRLKKRPGVLSKLLRCLKPEKAADLDVLMLRKGNAPLPSTVFTPGFHVVSEIFPSIFCKGSHVPKQSSGLKPEKAADLDDLEFGNAKGVIAVDSIRTSRHSLPCENVVVEPLAHP